MVKLNSLLLPYISSYLNLLNEVWFLGMRREVFTGVLQNYKQFVTEGYHYLNTLNSPIMLVIKAREGIIVCLFIFYFSFP